MNVCKSTNVIEHQKVHLIANMLLFLDNYKENKGNLLPSGRRIGTALIGVIYRIAELWATHYKNTGSSVLRTNRGNLSDAFHCSPRSTYNYLLDLNHLDILMWNIVEFDARGWIEIDINFEHSMFAPTPAAGNSQTDDNAPSAPNGKLCRTHYTNLKNNTDNNRQGGGQHDEKCGKVQKIEEEQKKEEQGQQKSRKTDKVAVPAYIELDPNFSKEFRAAPEADRKEIEHYANLLWGQAKKNLYNGREFPSDVSTESVELIATALLYQSGIYAAKRAEAMRDIASNPAYQDPKDEKYKPKWIARDLKRQPFEIQQPTKSAWLLLHRAVEIQRENCDKKGYSAYYPTYYFSELFDNAVHYACIEKKTMTTNKEANALRVAHCTAKLKLTEIISRAADTLKKFGFTATLQALRTDYRTYKTWLDNTMIKNKQKYLDRFVSQMSCIQKF